MGMWVIGCTRVVDLDLKEGPKRLVVEGRIERQVGSDFGLARVMLTTTDAFSNPTAPPPATRARVELSDESGSVFRLEEVADVPGIYLNPDVAAVVGQQYRLTIEYQGERYQAMERLRDVAPIDSLYFVYQAKTAISRDSGFRAAIDYRDPATPGDYYLWEQVVNDSVRISVDPGNRFRVISEDRFYNGGKVVGYQPFDELVVASGALVAMRQIGLSEAAFRYYAALFDQTNTGGPFSVPPSSVRGNLSNVTNPAHYPLGYFLATTVSERTGVVPARQP